MNAIATSPQPLAAAPELARRLGAILAGLVALVARRFLRMPHLVGLTVQLCARLGRVAWRFERAATRPARVRAPGGARIGYVRPAQVALPSGRAWLVRELGWEAAGYGCQLEALLAEPGMQAAAQLPWVGRILRPLCRMLGVTMPVAEGVPAVGPAVGPAEVVISRTETQVWPGARPDELPGVIGLGELPANGD